MISLWVMMAPVLIFSSPSLVSWNTRRSMVEVGSNVSVAMNVDVAVVGETILAVLSLVHSTACTSRVVVDWWFSELFSFLIFLVSYHGASIKISLLIKALALVGSVEIDRKTNRWSVTVLKHLIIKNWLFVPNIFSIMQGSNPIISLITLLWLPLRIFKIKVLLPYCIMILNWGWSSYMHHVLIRFLIVIPLFGRITNFIILEKTT